MNSIINPEHQSVIFDPETWFDNPYIKRDARRDAKRNQPFKSLLWLCGVLTVLCFAELYGLSLLHNSHLDHIWMIGGDPITALAAVFCGIHTLFIIGAAQKLTLRMITTEISQNTFSSLILLPSSPFKMIFQSVCYPWLAGMRIAFIMLPVYLIFVGLGGISWSDLCMLYLVYALISYSVPRWNKPALGDSLAQMPESGAQQFTAALRQNMNSSQPAGGVPVFGQWLSMSMMIPFLSLPLAGSLQGVTNLARYIPESLIDLSFISFLSWPLLLARGLIVPFDWFGHPVIPLFFCLGFFLLSRYCQMVKVVEFLQTGSYRELANLPTYQSRQNLEGLIKIGSTLVLIGYIWKWGVEDGGLGFISSLPAGRLAGQQGMLLVIMGITMWQRCLGRAGILGGWIRESASDGNKTVLRRVPLKSALRYLLIPILSGLLLYTFSCLLALHTPFPPGFSTLCIKIVLIGMAGMLLHLGAKAALGSVLSFAGYLILPAVILRPIQFHNLGYLSPSLGLINIANHNLFHASQILGANDHWWKWVLYCGTPGVIFTFIGAAIAVRAVKKSSAEKTPFVADPTQVGSEVFLDQQSSDISASAKEDTPLGLAIIKFIQRLSDNAVISKQLRIGLRGKLSINSVQRSMLIFLGVTAAAWFFFPQIPIVFGSYIANLLYGNVLNMRQGSATEIAAGLLGTWYIAQLFSAGLSAISILPLVFAVEREKSTLDFLLTTPMSAFSIVSGKASGLFITTSLGAAVIAVWTLVLSLVFVTILDPIHLLLGWLIMALVTFTVVCTIGMLAIAVASLLPKLITIRGSAVFNMLIIYGFMFGPQVLRAMNFQFFPFQTWNSRQISAAVISFLFLLNALFLMVSIWGVKRMRKADISFGITSRTS